MQEAIDKLSSLKVNTESEMELMGRVAAIILMQLEKEKEQIMNAYADGAKGGANGTKGQHEFGWVSRYTRKKYYNQTYNQNK